MTRVVCFTHVLDDQRLYVCIAVLLLSAMSSANPPIIDFSHNMRLLLLPNNTKVGSIIYRLKGTDADNDVIEFGVHGNVYGKKLLEVKRVSFHEADVYLKSPFKMPEYNITIYATDGKEKPTEVESTIRVTNSLDITESPFISSENIIRINESKNTNETIATISVRNKNNSNLPVIFELRGTGSEKFAIKYIISPGGRSNAEIFLVQKVDYEKQNLYILTIVALNPWTNENVDTRNIAVIEKVVAIDDIQDTAPVFKNLPNYIEISENTQIGSTVLILCAEDGDYGNQRNITYDIDPNSVLNSYFRVNEIYGTVVLRSHIHDIKREMGTKTPMTLNVRATEVVNPNDPMPALSTNANIGIVIVSTDNTKPMFKSEHLIASIAENSQLMTPVKWDSKSGFPQVSDDDPGINGTMILDINDPSDTFMIQPKRGMNEIMFSLVVKNNKKLDYESNSDKHFIINITAKDLSPSHSLHSSILCTINLIDLNDNIPQFSQSLYNALIPEDAEIGTTVVKIEATDLDSGDYGTVRFTSINGPFSDNLDIDSKTGVIVLKDNKDIDREMISEYRVTIEAWDESGRGNKNMTELHIKVVDINDNAPVFLQPRYDAILNPDRFSFTQPLFVKALDTDEHGSLNSEVRYEIIGGNYQDKFSIDENSGEITLKSKIIDDKNYKISNNEFNRYYPEIILTVRAHDLGIPYQNSTVPVYIHNPDFMNRTVSYIIDNSEENVIQRKDSIERGMSSLSGAKVHIYNIRPHKDKTKTEVLAWIAYPSQSAVDLSKTPIILSEIIGKDYNLGNSEQLRTTSIAGNDFRLIFWLLIILILSTLVFLIVFLICWFCFCRDRIRSREKQKDSEETNFFKTGVTNGSVVNEKSFKDKHKNPKTENKRRPSVEAWNEETVDDRLRSNFRPSSAPNNEQNHYSRSVRANSSQSDQYLSNNPSLYQRVNKMNRHQRVRVGPQYYDNFDGNDMHSSLSDYRNQYHSVRSHNPHMRAVKGIDNMGYLRTSNEPFLIDDMNEHTLDRSRQSVHRLSYNDKVITVPKRTEILYIQSPVVGSHEDRFRSISQNEMLYNEELDRYLDLPQNQSHFENIKELENIKYISKPKQRHIYFNDHNISDTIPEEGVVPGMVLKDGQRSDHLVSIPSVSGAQQIAYINGSNQRLSVNDENMEEDIASNDLRHHSVVQNESEHQFMNENSVGNVIPVQTISHNINERVTYSPSNDESIQITSVRGVPVSIELKKGVNKEVIESTVIEEIISADKSIDKNKRVLGKENSFENSEKSYDSDSGIGRYAMNQKIGFDMKNSGFMEKKSIFTIAYNDVKTRHLQSAESTVE